MTNHQSKNALIGTSTDDTLVNLSAVIMLLKSINFRGDINEKAEYGLYLIYTLIQESLEYEIKSLKEK